MIYIIIGTKGQFMKMFPVMKLFDKIGIDYKFIHTCQHYGIIERNRKRLKVRKPDAYLTFKKEDLKNIWEFLCWAPKVLFNARRLPITKDDFIIVHGDAESALLGLIIGKYFRAKIAHIEAGMRSGSYLEPFPEELTRTIVDLFSDFCFCPYEEDAKQIKSKRVKKIVTNGNTVFDAVKIALEYPPTKKIKRIMKGKLVPFLIHRKENLFTVKRTHEVIDVLEMILEKGFKVFWPLHGNTGYELKKKGGWQRVLQLKSKYDLEIDYFLDYVDFIHAVAASHFVASDGGGLQNETYFLNKPMLILRNFTENEPGLGETAYLSFLDKKRVGYFLNHYQKFKRKKKIKTSPSQIIVQYFKNNKER